MARKKADPAANKDKTISEVDVVMDLLNKRHGKTVVRLLRDLPEEEEGSGLSSGSLAIDWVINPEKGGVDWGKILQVYGPESSGKTTIALGFCASCTRMGKKVLFLDLEGTTPKDMIIAAGVDEDLLYYLELDGDDAAYACDMLIKTGEFGLVVVDSIPWWMPDLTPNKKQQKAGEEGDFIKTQVAEQALFQTKVVKKLSTVCRNNRTVLLAITQERMKFGQSVFSYGPSTKASSNKAMDHAKSVQLKVSGNAKYKGIVDSAGNLIGQEVKVVADKNKTSVPFKEMEEIPLIFKRGVEPHMELSRLSTKWGVITNAAGRYKWAGEQEQLAHGQEAFAQLLYNDVELYNQVRAATIEAMSIKYKVDYGRK